jgi:hypothetical protein
MRRSTGFNADGTRHKPGKVFNSGVTTHFLFAIALPLSSAEKTWKTFLQYQVIIVRLGCPV